MSINKETPIGKKYTLDILELLEQKGQIRYSELREELGIGSDSTYSKRLEQLSGAGLIQRKSFDEVPPRVEYSITERGGEEFRNHLSRAHDLCNGGRING